MIAEKTNNTDFITKNVNTLNSNMSSITQQLFMDILNIPPLKYKNVNVNVNKTKTYKSFRKIKCLYEKTKYPKIFEKVYWGKFSEFDDNCGNYEIIENRNIFKHENLIKSVHYMPEYIEQSIKNDNLITDHLECYKTTNGHYIIVSSPYDCSDNIKISYENKGWTQINKIYSINASSFMKKIKYRKYIRK